MCGCGDVWCGDVSFDHAERKARFTWYHVYDVHKASQRMVIQPIEFMVVGILGLPSFQRWAQASSPREASEEHIGTIMRTNEQESLQKHMNVMKGQPRLDSAR